MKRIACILFTMIICCPISDLMAQEWSAGKIVTNQNDTLSGLIAVAEYENLHAHCYYKSAINADKKIINVSDVKQLIFDKGQVFETKKIKTGKRNDTYLVEKLLTGIINLYSLTTIDSTANKIPDSKKLQPDNKYFNKVIYVAEITPQENRFIELISPDASTSYSSIKKRNIKILEAIFNYHPEMTNQINKASYSRNDLILLFKKYHEIRCKDYACITYIQKKEKAKIHIVSNLCFEQNELQNLLYKISYINDPKPEWTSYYKYQSAFQLLTSFDIIPFSKKLQLNIGLKIAKTNFSKEIYMSELHDTYQYKVNFIQLMPSLSASGTLFSLKLKPVIEAGTYLSLLSGQNNVENKLITNNYVFQQSYNFKNAIWGLFIGVGKDFKLKNNQSIPVRIQFSQAPFHMSPKVGENTFAHSFLTLKVGYSFAL